jgi:MFS transporter, ACS family, tartrate transporter
MADRGEADIMRRVAWRLVPFLGIGYYVNALDRSNIAVAALTMNKSLGFTAAEYGLGAGAFFWSYILFQVPSNVLLARFGARRWLSIIILAWALCSAATALVTGVTSFVVVRFLLGVAEAGYFPALYSFLRVGFRTATVAVPWASSMPPPPPRFRRARRSRAISWCCMAG